MSAMGDDCRLIARFKRTFQADVSNEPMFQADVSSGRSYVQSVSDCNGFKRTFQAVVSCRQCSPGSVHLAVFQAGVSNASWCYCKLVALGGAGGEADVASKHLSDQPAS